MSFVTLPDGRRLNPAAVQLIDEFEHTNGQRLVRCWIGGVVVATFEAWKLPDEAQDDPSGWVADLLADAIGGPS